LIGYHYTSLSNWEKVKKEGLVPYNIYKDTLEEYFPGGVVKGIWLWLYKLGGIEHAGEVLYHVAKKATFQVVHLGVEYEDGEELRHSSMRLILHHYGSIGNLNFHDGNQDAIIIPKFIPPEKITLIEQFDLMKAICELNKPEMAII